VTSKAAALSIAAALITVAGCSSSGGAATPTTSVPPAGVAPGPSSSAAATVVPGPTAAPEPTGVPGLSAPDPFCAAWAGYAGTIQALSVAASFGGLTGDRMAALELAAAPRLVELVHAIDQAWPTQPADVAAERATVMDRRIGPHARRAARGVDALKGAGASADELDVISGAWQEALIERDPQAPVIDVPSVGDLQTKVDAAAAAFDAANTPFAQDPSLSTGSVLTPATDAYLTSHCPELAASGIGDSL
jgi:hypothetical protein